MSKQAKTELSALFKLSHFSLYSGKEVVVFFPSKTHLPHVKVPTINVIVPFSFVLQSGWRLMDKWRVTQTVKVNERLIAAVFKKMLLKSFFP